MTMKEKTPKKTLEYFLALSYSIEVQQAEEGGFVISIPELPGCITQVEQWEDAYSSIDEVRKEWIKAAYEDGAEIPLPKSGKEYSGKFVLRIPKSMHRRLDERAEDEGVSLNTLLISMISECLGSQKAEPVPSPTIIDKDTGWMTLYSRKEGPTIMDYKTLKGPVIVGNIGGTDEYETLQHAGPTN